MPKRGNVIDHQTSETLLTEQNLLSVEEADRIVENVVGVFGLPIGLGLNFLINRKNYIVPMVVEEPSIVAAVSSAAKTVQKSGAFAAMSSEMLMIGQIAISGIADPQQAEKDILAHREEIFVWPTVCIPEWLSAVVAPLISKSTTDG